MLLPFSALLAQTPETPLTQLPYTPSLETKFLDRSADPCVNFYQYACGSWNKLNPIPADQSRWDVYAKLTVENQRYLWGILNEVAKPSPSRPANDQKIGDFFASCMDEAAIEKAGLTPLQPELDAIAGLKSAADLAPVLAGMHVRAINALFGFGSNQDYADSNAMIAFALAGGLGLPERDYYTKTDAKSVETRAKYVAYMTEMFGLLGEAPARAKADAATVMAMETELAKASLTRVELRDPYKLFHKMTRTQLEALTPRFSWAAYWKALGLKEPESLNVTEPAFYKEVEHLIETRPLADWKTYLRFHALSDSASFLSKKYLDVRFGFYSTYLRGVKQQTPRWRRCVRYTDEILGEALGKAFADRTFTPETKAKTIEMVKQIEAAMEADINSLPWMGEETKKAALVKLHGVINKIGYPDKWRDYSALTIRPDDFLGNMARGAAFELKRDLDKIGKPVDRMEW